MSLSRMVSLTVISTIAIATPALADNKADALFKKGKKLLDQKRYAEACEAFESSDKLDASIGTKLNAAKCFEDWGKLATSLRWYRAAEKAATEAKDERLAKIHEHLVEVDGDTPRLTLRTAKDADTSVVVLLDGAPAKLDETIEVDPGAHVVEYPTEGGAMKKKVVPVERGGASDVKLDLPKRRPGQVVPPRPKPVGEPVVTPPPKVELDDPGKSRRILGYGLGGLGVVGVGVSTYLTLSARGDYRDALASHCGGSSTNCDTQGLSITHDARTKANIATVVFSAGLLAIAGGVVLYVLAPKATAHEEDAGEEAAYYLAPSIGDHGGGLVFGGRY
ncbi:MAG: hypothetical protein NT062_07265 [Proteobacteria bacterium]|nr:hypothetical protein [Pseudomonadota bacterium]